MMGDDDDDDDDDADDHHDHDYSKKENRGRKGEIEEGKISATLSIIALRRLSCLQYLNMA